MYYTKSSIRYLMEEISTIHAGSRHKRPLWWMLTGILLVSLVVTLAIRFNVGLTVQHTTMAKSGSLQAMVQRMNRNAFGWTAPVLDLGVLTVPSFHPRVALPDPTLPSLPLEENLYNRPPPSC